MNGVLYPQPQGGLIDPRSAMMMQTGLGLMQASGPSRYPVGLGSAFGQAASQGLNTYQQALQAQQMDALKRQQLAMQQAEMERRAAIPVTAGPGTQMFRPGETTPFHTVPFKPAEPQEVKPPPSRTIRVGNEQVTQEFSNGQWREVGRGAAFSDKPMVTVDNRQESEFNKKVGSEMGEQYSTLLKADMNAPTTISKYQRLGQLLSNVNTGKFKGTTTELKATAKSLGVDLNAIGVADDVAPAQAARALSNQLALEMRNPSGGAGMPGALSDKDREFLVQSLPTLESDPGAVGKMIEYRVKLAQREQQVARKARDYRKRTGKFDEGFFDELADWSAKNPLFQDQAPKPKPSPGGLSAEEQKELEALRKRFGK